MQLINAKAVQGVGLSSFSVVGDELYAVLTDHTILGPYPLPVTTVTFVGGWLPSHQYYTNNIFTMNGSTYIVLQNHTSAVSFDPGANDGSGNDFYGLLLSDPANALPIGGAPGMALEKATTADFSVLWAWPTLAGLHDVLPSPGPTSGELVYWTGAAFSYLPQASVSGARQSLAQLADVLHSPGPTTGELVYWNGSAFSYLPQSSITAGAPPTAFEDLTDVLASPAPTYGQLVYWNGSAFTYKTPTTAMLTDWFLTTSPANQWDVMGYDAANLRWASRQPLVYNSGHAGTFTLSLSDAQNLVDIATGGVITVPTHASIAFAKGTAIWIRQTGAMSTAFSVAAAAGVTLNKPAGRIAQPRALGSIVMLQQTSTFDTWELSGDLAYDNGAAVTMPTTGNFNVDPRLVDADVFYWAPAGNQTATALSAQVGKRMTFVITTSGTSSFTLTFGAGFKTTGTLTTGTVTAKVFVIAFIGDGTNFNEVSRTTAM